jgi:hypothetical protein
MRLKRKRCRGPAERARTLEGGPDHGAVAAMNPVEIANSNNGSF